MPIRNPLTRRRHVDSHLVWQGRVGCPVVGRDVEVDACFACGKLKALTDDGPQGTGVVVCSGRPATAAFAPTIPPRA